jgi:hypothetical protein
MSSQRSRSCSKVEKSPSKKGRLTKRRRKFEDKIRPKRRREDNIKMDHTEAIRWS